MDNAFFLRLEGKNFTGHPYRFSLGPWTERNEAIKFSDFLTDTRIGEQILEKFGVERLSILGKLDS